MRTAAFDTSVLYALINKEDEHHKRARTITAQLERIVLPGIVIHEIAWILRRKTDTETVREIILDIISRSDVKVLPITEEDIGFAAITMQNSRDYNDLLILSAAKRSSVPLISFDDELRKKYGKLWKIMASLE